MPNETGSLMERTLALLNETKTPLPDIAAATGISFYWLRHFKSREYKDPSVNRVERLYVYLSGTPLFPVARATWQQASATQ